MRSAVRAFAVVFVLGVLALVGLGLLERRSEAFTLGVQPAQQFYLGTGSVLCQSPVEVQEPFSGLRFTISAAVVRGPAVRVEVLDADDGARLAAGTLAAGYRSVPTKASVALDNRVDAGRRVRICMRPVGRRALLVFGNAAAAARGSEATVDGEPRGDIDIVFLRDRSSSVLGLTADMVSRAALFHGGWVGDWTLWLVLALLVTAFPLLLVLALRRAADDDQPTASASEKRGLVSSER